MRRTNRGQVLILLALALFVLLGFAALAIDVGMMYLARHELQRCADSGALAGASAFLEGAWEETSVKDTAEVRARDFASKDTVITTLLDSAGEVAVNFPSTDRIRVTTMRTVPLFFARIFGVDNQAITATAVAEAATVTKKVTCLKPWGISFPWNDNNLNGVYDPGEQIHDNCPEGVSDPTWYFCPRSLIQIKVSTQSPNNVPVPQQEPSHFFALDFGQLLNDAGGCEHVNEGAESYLKFIEDRCLDDCVKVSLEDPIPVEPGNMPRKTIEGAQYLINQDPDASWPEGSDHPVSGEAEYAGDSWVNSPRVVRIPIYDPRVDQLSPGSADIHIAAFAGMWIDHVDPIQGNEGQGTVYGRYIPISALGGSGPAEGPAGTPTLKILRLVE